MTKSLYIFETQGLLPAWLDFPPTLRPFANTHKIHGQASTFTSVYAVEITLQVSVI